MGPAEYHITLSLIADTPEELSLMTVQAQVNWGMKLAFSPFSQLRNGKFITTFEMPYRIYAERVANGKG